MSPPPPTAGDDWLARRIRSTGPLTIAAFMAAALGHPQHGYYTTRDPLGAAGDFTTAPEISQMFGELIGLWCAQVWLDQGSPRPVRLVELGPGRGTLMADALRALVGAVPDLASAVHVHLVETSPVLRQRQTERLAAQAQRLSWHDRFSEVPDDGAVLVVANEFFDALPIRQLVRTPDGWAERCVGLDPSGRLAFVLDRSAGDAMVPPPLRAAPVGSVVEIAPLAVSVACEIGQRIAARGGGALVVDYGYEGPAVGDTLQAVRAHAPAAVLDQPGQADLTAHVDFRALAVAAMSAGADAYGPVGQGQLLEALGIRVRADRLKRLASPSQAVDIDAGLRRLTDAAAMGTLFKALGLVPAGAAPPPGFPPAPSPATAQRSPAPTRGTP